MSSYWDALPLVIASALVLLRPLWTYSRHAVTLAHEAGHALAALATGRRLTGIRLHTDTSGLTLSRGKPRGPGMVLTAAAGYLAPSLLGLAGALLIAAGHLSWLLWGTVGLLVVMLPFVRNVFGLLVFAAVGAGFGLVAHYGSGELPLRFGQVAIWLLLLGNLRTIVEVARSRTGGSDLDQLRALTHLPRVLWVLVLGAVAVGAGVLAFRANG